MPPIGHRSPPSGSRRAARQDVVNDRLVQFARAFPRYVSAYDQLGLVPFA